jgi:hypothetical protein
MTSEQEPPFDYHKWIEDNRRRDAERAHDNEFQFSQNVNEAAVNSGNLALRTVLTINGGSALAVLAFIGNALVKSDSNLAPKLLHVTETLVWFAGGVVIVSVAMGFAYFTNYAMASASTSKKRIWTHPFFENTCASRGWSIAANIFQIITIVLAFTSVGFFLYGMFQVRDAILKLL